MTEEAKTHLTTGRALLSELLSGELAGPGFDRDIVELVRKHLNGASIRSRAGQELGEDLLELARRRHAGREAS